MLIKQETVMEALARASITVKGVLHVGAHECEELPFYQRIGVAPNKCVWIDAVQSKVDQALARGIPNVFKAVVSDTDNATVTFHVTNNVQSSSILEFGTHEKNYSWVHVVGSTQETTTTLDTFFKEKGLDPTAYDFWNFDIQGAELMALKGGVQCSTVCKGPVSGGQYRGGLQGMCTARRTGSLSRGEGI